MPPHLDVTDIRHIEVRLARVLNAVENSNTEALSYEGGKRMVALIVELQ